MVWILLIVLSLFIKYNLNLYSKPIITILVEKNGENKNYNELYNEINLLQKFDFIIILGFFIIFFNSRAHTNNEKLSLLREDFGLFYEVFV